MSDKTTQAKKHYVLLHDWTAACAARIKERLPDWSADVVYDIAAACAENQDQGDAVHEWDDPAEAADEELSCWTDDGDD